MNDTDKLIQDQFNSLPASVQKALASFPWRETVRGIVQRINLSKDRAQTLETETMLLLYRMESPDDFGDNIIEATGLDEKAVDTIVGEVIAKVVTPLDAIIKKTDLASDTHTTLVPELSPEMLPEVLPGQTAHDVPHVESSPTNKPAMPTTPATPVSQPIAKEKGARPDLSFPQSSYPAGADPYREPLE